MGDHTMNWRTNAFLSALMPRTRAGIWVLCLSLFVGVLSLFLTGSNGILFLFSLLLGPWLGLGMRRLSFAPINWLIPYFYARLYYHAIGLLMVVLCLSGLLMLARGQEAPNLVGALLLNAVIIRVSLLSRFFSLAAVGLLLVIVIRKVLSEFFVGDWVTLLFASPVNALIGIALLIELWFAMHNHRQQIEPSQGDSEAFVAVPAPIDVSVTTATRDVSRSRSWWWAWSDQYGVTMAYSLKMNIYFAFLLGVFYWFTGELAGNTLIIVFLVLNFFAPLSLSLRRLSMSWVYELQRSRRSLAERVIHRMVITTQPMFVLFLAYCWLMFRIQPEDALLSLKIVLWMHATVPLHYFVMLCDFRLFRRTWISERYAYLYMMVHIGLVLIAAFGQESLNVGLIAGVAVASYALLLLLGPWVLGNTDMVPFRASEADPE